MFILAVKEAKHVFKFYFQIKLVIFLAFIRIHAFIIRLVFIFYSFLRNVFISEKYLRSCKTKVTFDLKGKIWITK